MLAQRPSSFSHQPPSPQEAIHPSLHLHLLLCPLPSEGMSLGASRWLKHSQSLEYRLHSQYFLPLPHGIYVCPAPRGQA